MGGVLQQIGRPKEVYNAPANLFVAGFIGSPPMNFVAGGIEDGRFRAEAVDIALGGSAKPGPATLGFRTEDAAIVEPGTGRFDGRVYAAEMTGEQTLVTVERGESTLSIKMPKDFEVDFDSVVGVGFPAEHGFLFDTESGARLEAAIAPD